MRVEIDGWKSNIQFSACHMIPSHGKCERLHGHNYAVHAKVYGEQNEEGIVIDFIELKNALRDITKELDHYVLLPKKSRFMDVRAYPELTKVEIGENVYQFPRGDTIILDLESTSAEELASYILERLFKELKFPDNVRSVEIGVDEGWGQGAWVRREL